MMIAEKAVAQMAVSGTLRIDLGTWGASGFMWGGMEHMELPQDWRWTHHIFSPSIHMAIAQNHHPKLGLLLQLVRIVFPFESPKCHLNRMQHIDTICTIIFSHSSTVHQLFTSCDSVYSSGATPAAPGRPRWRYRCLTKRLFGDVGKLQPRWDGCAGGTSRSPQHWQHSW